jgi:phospholipid/cholesterol/gamma-HCH transport system substrate-binding protein
MNGRSRISWRQVRVGLAVTVALVVLALTIFFVGETGAVFGERYRLITLMPSANGLIQGANVRLAGQDVGKVERIEFVPVAERSHPDHVLKITLGVNRAVSEQIRADSEARIRTLGLLGDKIIDLTPGTADAPVLEEDDTVASAVALDYEQMLGSAFELVDDVAVMLGNLRSIADSLLAGHGTAGRLLMDTTLYAEMLRTSRSMNRFLNTVGSGEGVLAQLAEDDQLYEDLRSVIADLDTLTAVLVSGEGTLSRLLTDETLYWQLAGASARADSLLAALEAGEGTLGQLMTDQELYESVLKLLVDMQTVVTELRENPRKYVPPIRVF